jgi:S1-C subfamily serine protease
VRKLLATPLVSALLGGGVVAGVLLGTGAAGGGDTRTVYQQSPFAQSVADGEEVLTARDIYKRDAPGVAYVRARVLQSVPSPFDLYGSETQESESTGSGFVIDEEGRVLTNAHVVANATQVTVTLDGDTTREAKVVGKDESTDLALLQIDPKGLDLQPLALGDSEAVEVGDPTVAIGNPFGFDRTLTTGVVSALQRRIVAPDGYAIEDVIQTDAAINPGNSGGPLIDAAGRVIGINSQIATGGAGGGSVGIGFAVPVNTAKAVVRELLAHGRVERAWIGVELRPIEPGMESLELGADRGMLVQRVDPEGPAAAAGLMGGNRPVVLNTGEELLLGGDVITHVAGRPLHTVEDLRGVLSEHEPGDTVALQIVRRGAAETVTVTLANQPAGRTDG